MKSIKLVTSVERTLCSNLTGMLRRSSRTVMVPDNVEWKKISVRAHPSLSISEKVESKVPILTATLKFFTCQDFADRKKYAFRVKLVDGSYILIGSGSRPYPIMTVQENMPEKPSDNQWKEVTVTWSTSSQIPQIGL